MLWDERMNTDALHSELMRESAAAGAYSRYTSLADLCHALHLPAEQLASTLAEFESHDDVTGWTGRLEFPLHASPITSGILTTQGGLVVDTQGRVLTPGSEPIDGLFAAGGTAIGISGPTSEGYSSGNGLLSAMGLGWIIGTQCAASVSRV
jgi:fumarate reductase flavoprotein subunit